MSRFKRILNLLLGVVMILFVVVIQVFPEAGYIFLLLSIGIGITAAGMQQLIYYFAMAKHMVDGKLVLYKGVIELNLGLFTLAIADIPKQYAMLYLMVGFLFSAAVTLMGAMEARRLGADFWKRKLAYGILKVLIAIAGLVAINSIQMMMLIYGIGLVASAFERIAKAFRRTEMVYVQ